MALPRTCLFIVSSYAVLVGCGSDTPVGPAGGVFTVGQSLAVESGRDVHVLPGTTDGEFIAVVANVALDSNTVSAFTLRSAGAQGSTSLASSAGARSADLRPDAPTAERPWRDEAFESRLRDREIAELTPRMSAARTWNAARVPALPAVLNVGDLVNLNVNIQDPCKNAVYHPARVVAIGTKSIVLNDTLNPKLGFTTADFQRYAAKFDTLVYPLDAAAFGEPTDIDKNGRVAIVFTRAVNELTPRNSISYVGGLAFTRDLFPQLATSRTQACPSSNEGEYFYLMTPDPGGAVNGNRRSAGFVDSNTTAVIAHELEHIINASRKLYVNTAAPKFEEKWLDEGLAHMAEELLFYRESKLSPRSNLNFLALTPTPEIRNAFANDMTGNASRYRDYLVTTSVSSPYAAGDSLSTRGGTWSLLRFLADQNAAADGDVWSRLVNNTATGTANLQAVFGRDIQSLVRDWAVSIAVDDIAGAPATTQQKSWNFRSIFSGLGGITTIYPLPVTGVTIGTSYSGTVTAGGSTYYTLAVPANGSATLTLAGAPGSSASNLQLVIVRTK